MIRKDSLQVGQTISILRQGSVDSSRNFVQRYGEYIIDEITEDYVKAHQVDRPEKIRKFIENERCGLIENKNFFRNAAIFLSREEAYSFFEKNILENWFRVEFSKIPHTDYSLEQLRRAKKVLES